MTAVVMTFGAAGCGSTVAVSSAVLQALPSLAGIPSAPSSPDSAEPRPTLALALPAPISCTTDGSRRVCAARVSYTDIGPLAVDVPVSRTTALVSSGASPVLSAAPAASTLELAPGGVSTVAWSAPVTDGDLTGVALEYAGYRYTVTSDGATADPEPGTASPSPGPTAVSPPGSPATRAPSKRPSAHPTEPAPSTVPPVYVPPVARTFPVAPPVHRNPGGAASVSATIG